MAHTCPGTVMSFSRVFLIFLDVCILVGFSSIVLFFLPLQCRCFYPTFLVPSSICLLNRPWSALGKACVYPVSSEWSKLYCTVTFQAESVILILGTLMGVRSVCSQTGQKHIFTVGHLYRASSRFRTETQSAASFSKPTTRVGKSGFRFRFNHFPCGCFYGSSFSTQNIMNLISLIHSFRKSDLHL